MSGLVLVTGASRGIGAATAVLAAAHGYKVAVNYVRDEASAADVCTQIEQGGGSAFALQGDVAREEDVLRLFERIDAAGEPLTGMVNNVGVVGYAAPFEEYTAERMQRTFDTNLLGAFLVARETVKRMSAKHGGGGGAIVNVSSVAARIGSPNEFIDYAASKGAIDTMTIGLAKEFGEHGIRVNAVRPGIIDTEIHASLGDPDRPTRLAPTVPLKRVGRAEEVARAIVWLLSDAASYSTGAILDIAGGR